MGENKGSSAEQQLIIFKLGNEKFGIDIGKVREIITMQQVTKVPHTHEYIEGIINLRGRVIPIFNIKNKFNFPENVLTRLARIMVAEVAGNTMGMIVDGVNEVLRIHKSIIEEPSDKLVSGLDEQYMEGIAKLEEDLVIILDLGKVLNSNVHRLMDDVI